MKSRSASVAAGLSLATGALLAGTLACTSRESVETPADPNQLARVRLADGPVEEVRIRLDTKGGFVVSGFSYFPENTRLGLVLYDSTGGIVARTQAEVVNSLFQFLPLAPPGGRRWPAGGYAVSIEAVFAPGAQPERVLQASRGGTALSGDGMTTTVQGRPAFAKRIPFMVPASGGP